MKTVVVDSNVALGWLALRKDSESLHRYAGRLAEASATKEARLIAPYVFTAECAYTLLKRGRAQGWPEEELQMYAELLDFYPIAMDEDVMPLPEQVEFALQHNVQGFDALYLALAIERNAALATADKGLRAAAELAGVEVF
ncbi:type II toxin-antitoxin system VapC family toxin [Mitsuaria sp. CC2]|uniref:type II toxin-antitoxin system VapC family toxin n=1 Tax=Mitsuaria sp. CC2 TaxID=3029186 RepID=UPI003B8DF16A